MATPSRMCSAPGCKVEVLASLKSQGLCLEHYIEQTFRKLDLVTDYSRSGQSVDSSTLEWLVAQVDCIVETVGSVNTAVDPERHSRLLELLLAMANLHEHAVHQLKGDVHIH